MIKWSKKKGKYYGMGDMGQYRITIHIPIKEARPYMTVGNKQIVFLDYISNKDIVKRKEHKTFMGRSVREVKTVASKIEEKL